MFVLFKYIYCFYYIRCPLEGNLLPSIWMHTIKKKMLYASEAQNLTCSMWINDIAKKGREYAFKKSPIETY